MADETTIGAGNRSFPSTQWSRLMELKDRDRPTYLSALNELCRLYWKPVYVHIRASRPVGNEEAKDLAQEFFVELIEGDLLKRLSPDRGTFRGYLKGAVRLFLLERHRTASAQKRGGNRQIVPLDDAEVRLLDQRLVDSKDPADDAFDRQWGNSLLDLAVGDLRKELKDAGKETYFKVFERHQLAPSAGAAPTHAEIARELGLKESDVNHYLAACRKALRERIVDRIRAYIHDESEIAGELQRLFSM